MCAWKVHCEIVIGCPCTVCAPGLSSSSTGDASWVSSLRSLPLCRSPLSGVGDREKRASFPPIAMHQILEHQATPTREVSPPLPPRENERGATREIKSSRILDNPMSNLATRAFQKNPAACGGIADRGISVFYAHSSCRFVPRALQTNFSPDQGLDP